MDDNPIMLRGSVDMLADTGLSAEKGIITTVATVLTTAATAAAAWTLPTSAAATYSPAPRLLQHAASSYNVYSYCFYCPGLCKGCCW